MMKWEAEQKGYTCNDCFQSMQNCHDISICCEDETGLCDYFEYAVSENHFKNMMPLENAIDLFVNTAMQEDK